MRFLQSVQPHPRNMSYSVTVSMFYHFRSTSSALHGGGHCAMLDRRKVPSVIIDYEDDKENMPDESDYEDLPSMYKDEDDDVDDNEDDEEDDDIFTSEWRSRWRVNVCLWTAA